MEALQGQLAYIYGIYDTTGWSNPLRRGLGASSTIEMPRFIPQGPHTRELVLRGGLGAGSFRAASGWGPVAAGVVQSTPLNAVAPFTTCSECVSRERFAALPNAFSNGRRVPPPRIT